MNEFKVIQIKINEYDGDSYEYVSKITTDDYGNIKIIKCGDILNAMRFNNWKVQNDNETNLRDKLLDLVKSYFPKKNHTITYHKVKVVY